MPIRLYAYARSISDYNCLNWRCKNKITETRFFSFVRMMHLKRGELHPSIFPNFSLVRWLVYLKRALYWMVEENRAISAGKRIIVISNSYFFLLYDINYRNYSATRNLLAFKCAEAYSEVSWISENLH